MIICWLSSRRGVKAQAEGAKVPENISTASPTSPISERLNGNRKKKENCWKNKPKR